MITRSILLDNDFEFRLFDGSKPESLCGDYRKYINYDEATISIMFSAFGGWTINICNHINGYEFRALNKKDYSVDDVNLALKLCKVDYQLKR